MPHQPPRPNQLIDALEDQPKQKFEETVWRVTRETNDPLQAGRPGGRWDDKSFDVIYTSTSPEGAILEKKFHLYRGQPVAPSKVKYLIHKLEISLSAVLDLSAPNALEVLEVNMEQFGQLSYAERQKEYPSTQQVGEVAHFLGCDGILVPSARSGNSNLVIFAQRTRPHHLAVLSSEGPIDMNEPANT